MFFIYQDKEVRYLLYKEFRYRTVGSLPKLKLTYRKVYEHIWIKVTVFFVGFYSVHFATFYFLSLINLTV